MSEQDAKRWRETLNLPSTAFPMKADLARREPERLAEWNAAGLYRRLRAERSGRPLWVLHDGPPYSNNHIHMGTAANKVWKDAAVRQATLEGYDSPYLPGWDNHGMPIEMQVSKDFAERKQRPDRLELRRACRDYARNWIGIQREEFKRLGGWGDWEQPYQTMDPTFEADILDTLAVLVDKGFVQRGKRAIHWCPTDRTALAMAEIEYRDHTSHSIHVRFPLLDDPHGVLAAWPGVSAVAWTTTPWTLPANRGLMFDPSADYAVVRVSGQVVILAQARVTAFSEALGVMAESLGTVAGADLIGCVFEGPFGNRSLAVDGSPFVSMDDGTGIVHTAPGHGAEDFVVGMRSGLEVASPVDEGGRFSAEVAQFAGRSVLDVSEDIVRWLGESGRLLHHASLRHSYPHCWRCRRPVIFRATDQWFFVVDHDGHRDRCLELIESSVKWDPPSAQNRFREAVRTRPDWCLSRQRSWGVGIPAVYCDDCGTATLDAAVVRRVAEATRQKDSDVWYETAVGEFLPEGFRCPQCGGAGPFRAETDVLDVWFDSGTTFKAVQAPHHGLAHVWQLAARGQARVVYFEGPDQHRGWFNSSFMVGVGADQRPPFTDVCTHGWVLDGKGQAMHKSLGNVISPLTLIEKHGADVVRWWALATDWRGDVRVGDEILQRVADAYRKVRNTFRFLLGNLDDFTAADAVPEEDWTRVDRAFADHLAARITRIRASWRALLFHRALDDVLELCTVDLSAVYLDVAKDRLYTLPRGAASRRSAQTVLMRALRDLSLAVSPALVFTADEVWQHHGALRDLAPSVHLAEWPAGDHPGDSSDWLALLDLRDRVNAAIEPLRAAKSLATTAEAEITLTAPASWWARHAAWQQELAGFLIVASITFVPGAEGAEPVVEVHRTTHSRCDRCWMFRADVTHAESTGALCRRCREATGF